MAKCSNCGAELNAGAKFCEECGTPVPQTKACPKCGAQLKPEAKFCSECGYSFAAKSAPSAKAGVSVGDKNVIAGDVVGESYKIHGNATIVKNEDETKKMVRCHVCGRNMPITEAITCVKCGEYTCETCMDMRVKNCKACVESAAREQDNVYRQAVVHALEDGVITLVERRELKALQKQLGISDQHADEIEDHVRADGARRQTQVSVLSSFEKLELERALEMFYGEDDPEGAFIALEPIYKRHPDNEEVVSLYADLLVGKDADEARQYLDSLRVDILGVKTAGIDLAFKEGDFADAETRLDAAEGLWPDSVRLQCRRIAFYLIMHMHSNDTTYLDQARSLAENIAEGETKLERSEVEAAIRAVMEASGEEFEELTEDECEERGLYYHIANESLNDKQDDPFADFMEDDESDEDDDDDSDGDTEDEDAVVVSAQGDADYKTIEEAVKNVPEGGAIVIKGGRYPEFFKLEKKVSIMGMEGCEVIVEPKGDEQCSIEVMADVTIKNIVFDFNPFVRNVDGPYCSLGFGESAKGNVESCRFEGRGCGIAAGERSQVVLAKCKFADKSFAAIIAAGQSIVSVAETEFENARTVLSDNAKFKAKSCSMNGSQCDGFVIQESAECQLVDCRIRDCAGNGIEIDSSDAKVTVKNCTIEKCKWAIHINGGADRWLRENNCTEFNFVYKGDKLFRFENDGSGCCRIDNPVSFNVGSSGSFVQAARINNDAAMHTGDLSIGVWLTQTPYAGGHIEGYYVAEGHMGPLTDGYGWSDKKVQCKRLTASAKASGGDYYAVIVVNELTIEPDGTEHNYIIGYNCFDKKVHWN